MADILSLSFNLPCYVAFHIPENNFQWHIAGQTMRST